MVTIYFADVGSDLVATYSGTINTHALTTLGGTSTSNVVRFDADVTECILNNSAFDGAVQLWSGISPSANSTPMNDGTVTSRIGGAILATSDSFGIDW